MESDTTAGDLSSFDPTDPSTVKHSKAGAWDVYTARKSSWLPKELLKFQLPFGMLDGIMQDLPYLRRIFQDVTAIAWDLVAMYILIIIPRSFLPSIGLWYTGQLLQIVQEAVEKRTVDRNRLVTIAVARVACSVSEHIADGLSQILQKRLSLRISRYHSIRIFKAFSRLDVPTAANPLIQSQLNTIKPTPGLDIGLAPVNVLLHASRLLSTVVDMISQTFVLMSVLSEQQDGLLLAFVTGLRHLFSLSRRSISLHSSTWAATTSNEKYIRSRGLLAVILDEKHRPEIFTNNLAAYMSKAYKEMLESLGDYDSQGFWPVRQQQIIGSGLDISSLFSTMTKELPQIVFVLRAAKSPLSVPITITSLNVVERSTNAVLGRLTILQFIKAQYRKDFEEVKRVYDLEGVPNTVVDGTEAYPENSRSIQSGVALEFINVSFKYPGKDTYALRNISFRVVAGQLCVIVGVNGSGKSTVLKLIARLYDATEGEILIDGRNIKTLKLADLHRAMAVLFQDYTHFELSLRDNIALGDPENADNEDHVQEAARLGGVDDIINKQPHGYATYLIRPSGTEDIYMNLPPRITTLFGREVEAGRWTATSNHDSTKTWLSGGQMQRLALTFMRSLPDDERVGLLLYDEPSAHLDPRAELDLFDRLTTMRGSKTMIFSTHRFGKLTRKADLILCALRSPPVQGVEVADRYMNDSNILEAGTHEQLLSANGEYGKLWNIQAEAFA